MKVLRGTITQGRNWEAKPTTTITSAREARRFQLRRPATNSSAASPNHHTAGLPMQLMEEIMPSGM